MTREEAIKIINCYDIGFYDLSGKKIPAYKLAEAFDMAIKALQAELKHGKWIEEKDGWYGGQGCRCSSCGYGYSYKAYHEPYEFDFCPNCGCAMTKEKEK